MLRVSALRIVEIIWASALGAGMTAAFGAGWFSSIAEAAHHMTGDTKVVEPNVEVAERVMAPC